MRVCGNEHGKGKEEEVGIEAEEEGGQVASLAEPAGQVKGGVWLVLHQREFLGVGIHGLEDCKECRWDADMNENLSDGEL